MREFKIKETCGCGAILECYETTEESWEHKDSKWRQDAFHKAHENCRRIEITGVPLVPKS